MTFEEWLRENGPTTAPAAMGADHEHLRALYDLTVPRSSSEESP